MNEQDGYLLKYKETEPETKVIYNNVPFKDMAWSDEHKNIFKAWANAKKEMPIIVSKEGVNKHFGSKYSTLDASLVVGIPVFAKHGISVIQMPTDDLLLNLIAHESGEWIAFRYKMQIKEQTAQGRGSALTYARRYCFQSLAGLAPGDDDDGEAAMGRSSGNKDDPKPPKPKTPRKKPSEQAKEWEKETKEKQINKEWKDEMKNSMAFDDKTVPFEVDPPPAADPPADYVPDGIAKILAIQIPRQKTAESLEGISVRIKNEEKLDDAGRQFLEDLIAKQRKETYAESTDGSDRA